MKYNNFTVEDFVKDEYFQKWILNTDTMTSNFWKNWVAKFPEKQETIEEAKRLITLMSSYSDKDKLSDKDFNEIWQHIIQKRNTKSRNSKTVSIRRSKRLYWKFSAAASVALLITLNYFFNKKTDSPQFAKPIIVESKIIKGSNKAILTLSDGSNITLEKGQTYTSKNITSNGEEIVYKTKKSEKIAYNYLTIPRGGDFFLKLSDGTQVWLNSESQLKYPAAFIANKTRKVELVYGEAYFDVSPSMHHKGAAFKVYNRKQEIHVLGTEFNVKAYKDENKIYTTLIEGKVAVSYQHKKQYLTPSQQSILNIDKAALSVKTVDVYNEISWKEGVFSFEDKTLEEVMTVLCRWYDMEVEFKNKSIVNEVFVGVLEKNQKIEEILTNIKNLGIIKKYEIKNKKVVLE